MALNFDHNRPIYIQLMEYFYGKICRSELKLGEKLPSVRETAVNVGVNPNTVSRTYMEMERELVVVSKRGQGTFVTEDKAIISHLKESTAEKQVEAFLQTMKQNGFSESETLQIIKKKVELIEMEGDNNE